MTCKCPTPKFVLVEWKEGKRYHGGSYVEADLLKLFTALRARGVRVVYVEDREVSL